MRPAPGRAATPARARRADHRGGRELERRNRPDAHDAKRPSGVHTRASIVSRRCEPCTRRTVRAEHNRLHRAIPSHSLFVTSSLLEGPPTLQSGSVLYPSAAFPHHRTPGSRARPRPATRRGRSRLRDRDLDRLRTRRLGHAQRENAVAIRGLQVLAVSIERKLEAPLERRFEPLVQTDFFLSRLLLDLPTAGDRQQVIADLDVEASFSS